MNRPGPAQERYLTDKHLRKLPLMTDEGLLRSLRDQNRDLHDEPARLANVISEIARRLEDYRWCNWFASTSAVDVVVAALLSREADVQLAALCAINEGLLTVHQRDEWEDAAQRNLRLHQLANWAIPTILNMVLHKYVPPVPPCPRRASPQRVAVIEERVQVLLQTACRIPAAALHACASLTRSNAALAELAVRRGAVATALAVLQADGLWLERGAEPGSRNPRTWHGGAEAGDAAATLLAAVADSPGAAADVLQRGGVEILLRHLRVNSRTGECAEALRRLSRHHECCEEIKLRRTQ